NDVDPTAVGILLGELERRMRQSGKALGVVRVVSTTGRIEALTLEPLGDVDADKPLRVADRHDLQRTVPCSGTEADREGSPLRIRQDLSPVERRYGCDAMTELCER